MKNIRKLISFLLAAVMLIASVGCALAAGNFLDVAAGSWYEDAAEYCFEHGLISGTGSGKFSPGMNLSRGMLAMILWRNEGSPVAEKASFADVKAGSYYEAAVGWATEAEIVAGYGNNRFGPDDDIERQQLAAMLYRYAEYKGEDVTVAGGAPFADDELISNYAKTPVAWAREKGIISGKGNNRFDPTDKATRGEAATMVYRYLTMDDGETPGTDEENFGGSGGGTTPTPAPIPDPTPVPDPTPGENENEQEEPTVEKLKIEINGNTLMATFADNSSAEALKGILKSGPLTVTVDDYGGFEKVGSLGHTLPRNDTQLTTVPGDVILYNGNQLTIHYGRNSWSYTRLAKIDDVTNLQAKLGTGTQTVTLSLA